MNILSKFLKYYIKNSPLEYGKPWVINLLPESNKKIIIKAGTGNYFEADLATHIGRNLAFIGYYEKNTIRHILRLCKPGMTFFDCGANLGYYSITIAEKLKEGRVFAFEPNEVARVQFEENLQRNPHLSNITLIPLGLSDKPGKAILNYNYLLTASIYNDSSHRNSSEITLIDLDSFCQEHKIENIDIIKVDIEGGELAFLKGAHNILSKSKKQILVLEIEEATCKKAGHTPEQLFQEVISLGYTAYIPKPWPFKMKPVKVIPPNYFDNIIFLKGY